MAFALIVENHEQRLQALRQALEQLGFVPIPARTAREAFRRIEAQAPDLIVLNLALRDQEGVDTFCRMAGQLPPILLHASSPCWPHELPVLRRGWKIMETNDLLAMLASVALGVERLPESLDLLRGLAESSP